MGKRTNTARWLENQGRWQINVQKDGVRRSFTSSKPGRTGQREANAKADKWLDAGIEGDGQKVTKLYEEFLAAEKDATCEENYKNIESRWSNHIKPVIGNKRIGSLNEQDLQTVINRAYKKHDLSAKTLRNIRGDLAAFLKFCRMKKAAILYPENLTIPAGARRPERTILQPHDLIKLFNCTDTELRGKIYPEEYVHAFRVAVLTGLRPGELIGLRWQDIRGDKIHVCRSINFHGRVTQGKNSNAIRTITMAPRVAEEIEEQRNITGDRDTVFEVSTMSNYHKRWKKFAAYNGIAPISLYEMRHTFVSIAQNLPEGMVKKLVGHSQSMDTWGTYAHVMDGQEEDTAKRLEKTFDILLKA